MERGGWRQTELPAGTTALDSWLAGQDLESFYNPELRSKLGSTATHTSLPLTTSVTVEVRCRLGLGLD